MDASAAAAKISVEEPAAEMEDQEEEEVEEVEEDEAAGEGEGLVMAGTQPGATAGGAETKKWPGWPGDSVFRMIVPVQKVGSIIGRKGELIKKMCEETRSRIRILEGAIGTSDRIVLISGQEDMEAEISPAMSGALRVFKRVNGITEGEDGTLSVSSGSAVCSVRLLVAFPQAISLIGKGGTLIKSIQEGSGAIVRVLPGEDLSSYATSDERIIEIQGHPLKVLNALEGVFSHLRKFLVDHSVIPLFEKIQSSPTASLPKDHSVDAWAEKPSFLSTSQIGTGGDYQFHLKQDSLMIDREMKVDSRVRHSGLSLYGQDPATSGLSSSTIGRLSGGFVGLVTQTMQIPLSYAEDIIGVAGKNIEYVRRISGAVVTLQESRASPDEMTVEIKGTSSEVQIAQQLINEFMGGQRESAAGTYGGSYGGSDTGLRSSYAHLSSSAYSAPLASQTYGGYSSSRVGGGYDSSSYRY